MRPRRKKYINGVATLCRTVWPFRCDACPGEPCMLRMYYEGTAPPEMPTQCPVMSEAEWRPNGWRYEDYDD